MAIKSLVGGRGGVAVKLEADSVNEGIGVQRITGILGAEWNFEWRSIFLRGQWLNKNGSELGEEIGSWWN
jgi:hypothetical protein